jgi:hypothetical protein
MGSAFAPCIGQLWTVAIEPRDQCLSTAEQENSVLLQIRNNTSSILAGLLTVPQCGDGLWYRVAHIHMNDSTQDCPSNWKQINDIPVRACGRPTSTGPGVRCIGEYFSTRGLQYGKVCGRVIGYQEGSTDTFERFQNQQNTIDDAYVDGVSVTYGMPRTHIWTFAAGASEGTVTDHITNCPCANAWAAVNAAPAPSFVGDNYFCESGNPGRGLGSGGITFGDDPVWDGEQCEGECCSNGKSPPWFSVTLPNPTSDDIEVRICGDEGTRNEDTPIQLLEIYIQCM